MTQLNEPTTAEYQSIWKYLYRTPHTVRYVEADGYRTRILTAGDPDRPPLVLLHGTAGSVENFAANISAYAEHFHVVAIDMIGCGWTDRPTQQVKVTQWSHHVVAVMDLLHIERASMVGVSLGSAIAAYIAVDYPERVDRIVMAAPSGVPMSEEAIASLVAGVRQRRSKVVSEVTWDSIRTMLEGFFYDNSVLIDDLIAIRLDIYQDPAIQKAMPFLVADPTDRRLTEDEWRSLNNPILAIASVDVPGFFLDSAYRVGELAPKAEVAELRDCDHWPQFECADTFNEISLRFLGVPQS
ncbi:alpha/beta hydrolase [Nocardia sp. CA2R105]|uniref:alpha/beta fold hydrolase n=1 Tax=Nocardia coffeae TaxID=2873381 RepID=UPI001CA7180C|nr:alpha/beta hydrolase [Nocardia coffeae]MBY8863450.1 alpha/beta hydrolase [Nocardia coffeae]